MFAFHDLKRVVYFMGDSCCHRADLGKPGCPDKLLAQLSLFGIHLLHSADKPVRHIKSHNNNCGAPYNRDKYYQVAG